jgi:radical SAM protein with 4Fe4S-binding SPASM domain
MPNDHFFSLVSQAKHLGAETISIFGFGEPLIDPRIVDKVWYCNDKGLKTFITTNASLLHSLMAGGLLGAGLTHLRFSVHGLFSKDYEKIHNGLSFIETIRNIFNFIVINRKRFDGRCKVSATVIPMAGESIEHLRKFWEPHVNWLEVWKPHNWAVAKNFRNNTGKRLKSCGRPFRGPVQIQADGNVIPCCFLTDGEIILGNTYESTIEYILKDDPYEELRQRHEKGDLRGLPCEHCDQRFIPNESPLLYSNRDEAKKLGCTSSIKFNIMEE